MATSRRVLSVVFCSALVFSAARFGGVDAAQEEDAGWKQYFGWVPEPIKDLFGIAPAEEGDKILSNADILVLEAPREGFVAAGQTAVLRMTLPPSGGRFPNLLLTLSINNPGGDADLYCVPAHLFDHVNFAPGPDFYTWKSEHTQGKDYIFVSRGHEEYEAAKVSILNEGSDLEALSLVCSVVGYATEGSDYTVELDVDYSDRYLIREQRRVMQSIFDSCCAETDEACKKWRSYVEDDGSTSMDLCHMEGNICNSEGSLVLLNLSGEGMECEFPGEAIASLPDLRKLDLKGNAIKGDIVEILTGFRDAEKEIQYLDLSDNFISGNINESAVCELSHGYGLNVFKMMNNQIQGSLEACLFDASSELRNINLDGNSLTGSIPEIPSNSSIMVISLSATGLQGVIPPTIGDLESLVSLDLSENFLEGEIPRNLGSAKSLRVVRLNNNQLEGIVPGTIVTSKSLDVVRLDRNILTGLEDDWQRKNSTSGSRLFALYLSDNRIKGSFPSSLLKAPELAVLDISNNKFSGPLPKSSRMMPKVTVFLAAKNSFEGKIPSAFMSMALFSSKALAASPFHPSLDLSDNKLSGEVPSFLFADSVPQELWTKIRLGGNKFDLACPIPLFLSHIADLGCNNLVVGTMSRPQVVAKPDLRGFLTRAGYPVEDEEEYVGPQAEQEYLGSSPNALKSRPLGNFKDSVRDSGEAVSNDSSDGPLSGPLLVVVCVAVFLVSVGGGVFLFRWRRKIQWEKAVDAVLVKDFELHPSLKLQSIKEEDESVVGSVKCSNDMSGDSHGLP